MGIILVSAKIQIIIYVLWLKKFVLCLLGIFTAKQKQNEPKTRFH